MLYLKQSTAATEMLGPFVDAGDGVTEEIGLAGAGTEISKNGAAFATGPTLGTHDGDGWYPVSLTTTHTNTLGRLRIKCQASATHAPVWLNYMVLPASAYDALVGGTEPLPVDVTEWKGTTAPDAPPSNAQLEARTLLAASYFDPAADTVVQVTNVTNSGNATLGNNTHGGPAAKIQLGATTGSAIEITPGASASGIGIIGAGKGIAISTNLEAIEAESTTTHGVEIVSGGAASSALRINATSSAAPAMHVLNGGAGDGLRTQSTSGTDTDFNTTLGDFSGVTGITASANTTAIADAVWDELLSGHAISGSAGKIIGDNIDATISSRGTYDGGDVTGNVSGSVGSVTGNVDGTVAGVTPATASDVVALLTTQMTESYAADGVAPTLAQAVFLIQQMLSDFGITGTTISVKKLDGTTEAATFTLDDATTPTSRTRTT